MPTLKYSSIFLLPLLLITASSINQTCSPVECPQNSFCNSNQHCQCNDGWVLDCNLPSTTLTQEFKSVQISQTPLHFTVVPSSTDAIFVYRFEMCTDVKVKLNLQLFADEGIQHELNKDNMIGELTLNSFNQCWPLFSPYMEFGYQENGNIEQMILKVKVVPSESETNLTTGTKNSREVVQELKTVLKIRVNQMYFLKKSTLLAIIIAFISLIGLSFIFGIIYCIYAIRRGPRRFLLDNNIKYFQKLLPKQKLTSTDEDLNQSCSVCLIDFQINDEIRKTPCKHAFHYDCLDEWCRKNLTCPMCRKSLAEDHLQQQLKLDNMQVLLTNCSSSNHDTNNAIQVEFLEEELESDRKRSLREPLSINS